MVRRLAPLDLPAGVCAVDYGIRGMHLAYDLLDGWDALVLVDALPDRGEPGAVRVLDVRPEELDRVVLDPHGMDPGTVLASLRPLGGRLPRTIVVGCQVADVGEGMGLSAPVAAAVDRAVETVLTLLDSLRLGAGSR